MSSWLKASALIAVAGLTACTSSPTGRNQLLMFSDSEMSTLGANSFEQMKKRDSDQPKQSDQSICSVCCESDYRHHSPSARFQRVGSGGI